MEQLIMVEIILAAPAKFGSPQSAKYTQINHNKR